MEIDTTVSPLRTLERWIDEARALGIKDPDAMALATVSAAGIPSVRVVLCRGVDDEQIRFFTNYESRKGVELDGSRLAAAVFHFRELDRQVRVEGSVSRTTSVVSDAYFESRPLGNRIASCVSPQSRPIESLALLQEKYAAMESSAAGSVVRPAHWGGYELRADAVELWKANPVRLHECIRYERQGGGWTGARRAP